MSRQGIILFLIFKKGCTISFFCRIKNKKLAITKTNEKKLRMILSSSNKQGGPLVIYNNKKWNPCYF